MALSRAEAEQLCKAFRAWSRAKVKGRKPDASDVVLFNIAVTFQSDYGNKCTHPEVIALFRRRGLITYVSTHH